MNYRTTCPHCASVFRLGADQLDAAQGWVQCSVCGAAFDAHPGLLHADGSPLPPPEPPSPPEPVQPETAPPEPFNTPLAPASEATADALPADAVPETDTEAATPVGITQREAAPELSSIILIDPDQPPADDDPGPLPQIPAQSTMPPVYPPHQWSGPLAETAPPVRPVMAQIEYAQPQMRPAVPGSATIPSTPRRARTGLWVAASLVLLLMLAAQATYFLRDTLVSQWPQTRPALEQACAALGCTLSLPKKADAAADRRFRPANRAERQPGPHADPRQPRRPGPGLAGAGAHAHRPAQPRAGTPQFRPQRIPGRHAAHRRRHSAAQRAALEPAADGAGSDADGL
jgi:predicted Zn finger-like uncharacterized protein